MDLRQVLAEELDWRFKAFPLADAPVRIGEVAAQGWNALDGDLYFPIVLVNDGVLRANINLLARWCRKRGVSLAPHVKTPVAPQIADLQLGAGAWALSVATIQQAAVMRRFGATRLLMANELLDPAALRWTAAQLARDPKFELMCLVDSETGVGLMDEALAATGFSSKLQVLLEVGAEGGRCGCRTLEEARAVAARVAGSRHLRLVGVEGYENVFATEDLPERLGLIDATLDRVRETVEVLDTGGLFDTPELIVSGGGSLYFDRVVERLGGAWTMSKPVRLVLRCGSYITQDDLAYDTLSPLAGRASGGAEEGRLNQALEAWGMVLSRPERGLAVVGLGKRDVAHDRGFPRPFALKRRGAPIARLEGLGVLSLNDQHARLSVPADAELEPGDLVGFRISHPCTTFDNWRAIPVVDDEYRVVNAIRCYL
ncbi:MAG: alanine racemase [Candidatus Dormibacteria bacterium]